MAIVFAFIGLQGNPVLLFIALFVWIGAGQEASMTQMKSALADPVAPRDADALPHAGPDEHAWGRR